MNLTPMRELPKGYGFYQSDKDEPVDAGTLFTFGSTSIAFASAAIGTLVDTEKIAWDADRH